jgi:arginine/ornithine N-succinyltransferase beta subunit
VFEADTNQVHTITYSRLLSILTISDDVESHPHIITNTSLPFLATIGPVIVNLANDTCIINKETAHLLQSNIGETLRVVPLNRHS